ncbi:MAG: hypothetical protein ACYTG0_20075, partial [Planctomycetota bacterium]
MRHWPRKMPAITLVGCLTLSTGAVTSAAEPPASGMEEPAAVERPEGPQLSPEMAALRGSVRNALAVVGRQPFNTRDHTPGEIIDFCLVLGCKTMVGYGGPSSQKINALGSLCWNYPCGGYQLLRAGDGKMVARIGYGLQARPAQFLAVLGQSGVPVDYEVRIGDLHGTVADLVECEKLACRHRGDQSFRLIGLSHYIPGDETWKSDLGEDWSLEQLLKEELARSASVSGRDRMQCLMGLSYALGRRSRQELPIDGHFADTKRYLNEFQEFALAQQNADGSWHPSFFAYRGTSSDVLGSLRSTGHILRWLVFSLPEDRLKDPSIVRSLTYVTKALGGRRKGWNMVSMSPRDVATVMHAG